MSKQFPAIATFGVELWLLPAMCFLRVFVLYFNGSNAVGEQKLEDLLDNGVRPAESVEPSSL